MIQPKLMRQAGRRSNRQAKVEALIQSLIQKPDRGARQELIKVLESQDRAAS